MAAITLTPQDGGASVVVNTNIIYRVFAYGTGSRVMYGKGGANPYIMDVTTTPDAIVDSSFGLIEVTVSGGTEYLYAGNSANGDGKGIMMINENGTGSIVFFKYTEEAAPIYIYSTDSPAVLAARINALTPYPTYNTGSETITANGAVSTTKPLTKIDSTAATLALTLANAAATGTTKVITMTVFGTGHNAVLTPANLAGYTTITFNSVGDTVTLVFNGADWVIAGYSGVIIA